MKHYCKLCNFRTVRKHRLVDHTKSHINYPNLGLNRINDTNLYFIHTPETNGMSIIKKYSDTSFGYSNMLDLYDMDIEDVKNTIAILRNPYDRLLSTYKFISTSEKDRLFDYCQENTFEKFINDLYDGKIITTNHVYLKSQTSFLRWKDGKIHTNIARFEFVNEDLSSILGFNVSLEQINQFEKEKNWEKNYNEEMRRKVRKIYTEDFELGVVTNCKYNSENIHKIAFPAYWAPSLNNLDSLKRLTPKCNGTWKNLFGVSNICDSDFIVVFDDLDEDTLKMGKEKFLKIIDNNLDKIIFFNRENTSLVKHRKKSWFTGSILPKMKHVYSSEDGLIYTFTSLKFLGKTYDELKALKYKKKPKKISAVVSSIDRNEFYMRRKNFLINYSNNNKIDVYGKGWGKNSPLGENYKGELGSYHGRTDDNHTTKFDGLYDYEYSLCLENYPVDRIISEKFIDCILSWCIPIYSCHPCVKSYPKKSFMLIDISNKNEHNKIYKTINNFINTPPTEDDIESLGKTRNIFLDVINVWEHIYQIIRNHNEYKKKYKSKY